jgi:GT2 family glycosyltransferase
MIHYAIAYDLNKDLGKAYNDTMRRLDPGDYGCFIDGDAMFLHPYFGKQLQDYVTKYPDGDLFTCKTNRVGTRYMLAGDWASDDIAKHRQIAARLLSDMSVKDITQDALLSGVVMLIKRSSWEAVGGFREDGMLGIDNDMHLRIRRNNGKVYLMNGVYVYHWYRGGQRGHIGHLLKPGQNKAAIIAARNVALHKLKQTPTVNLHPARA